MTLPGPARHAAAPVARAPGHLAGGHPRADGGRPAIRLTRAAARPLRALRAGAARRPWLTAWLAFAPVPVLRAGTLAEADTFWQIRAGLITFSRGAIPATDTFTWTVAGRPWTLNSWGFNVGLALTYRIGGLPAVAWACAALAMAIAGQALLLARRLGASPVVAGACLLLASPLLVGWLTARPQLADYVAFLLLVLLLRRITSAGGSWRLVAAAGGLSALWVNLHAGALLGVAVAAAAALALLALGCRRAALWCLAAASASLAGSFLSPYGTGVIGQTAQVQADSAGLIVEWQPFNPASPIDDITALIGMWALAVAVRRRDAPLAAALGVAAASSALAIRMLPFLALIAVPTVASALSDPGPAVLRYARSRCTMFRRCGAAGLAALAVVALPSLAHIGRPDLAKYPVTIAGDIPRGCKVFSTDLIGGYLILARPDVLVSLDTRNTLYGRRRLLALERVIAGRGDLARGLAGAGCVLVPPSSGLAVRLRSDHAWELRASDPPAGVLYVRRRQRVATGEITDS